MSSRKSKHCRITCQKKQQNSCVFYSFFSVNIKLKKVLLCVLNLIQKKNTTLIFIEHEVIQFNELNTTPGSSKWLSLMGEQYHKDIAQGDI